MTSFPRPGQIARDPGANQGLRFNCLPLAFVLENSQTPRKYLPETMAGGLAVFDFDNDGRLDLFFTNGAELPGLKKSSPKFRNRLLRNADSGRFDDVTERAGVAGTGFDIGAAVGDYDNDGDADLFVAGVYRSTLYRNSGDGTFRDVTTEAGVTQPARVGANAMSVAGAWLDFDNDGWLDLFVTNYVVWNPKSEPSCLVDGMPDYCHPKNYQGLPNTLYRNNGNGTFSDVSDSSGIGRNVGKGMSAVVADYDGDGRPDIFVTNDKLFNFLFRNEGGGKFVEVGFDAGVATGEDGQPLSAMGADFRDIDNDGLPDLFYTALPGETFPLLRNLGKGLFQDATYETRLALLTRKMGGWSAGMQDLDNDGWKDIFVARSDVLSATGSRGLGARQPNSVLRNLGNGTMEDVTEQAGFSARKPQMYRGAAFGDLDGDGLLDVVVSALSAEAEVWMNRTPSSSHWLELKLEGTESNRDGIGARIELQLSSGKQFNHATTAVGYCSSSAGPVHFGLGNHATAALVEIRWPSGKVQRLQNVKGGHILRVVEPR